ncbi:MAG: hypothetical protein M3Z32_07155, partial [Acidobacteriota bacterium]|nr:hypothetical protein [Acidobacteriota bacterium]
MKKLFVIGASFSLTALLAVAQDAGSATQSWSGLLVSAACQSGTTADAGMPRKTAVSTREKNTTYEQTQNEADRPKGTGTHDAMARTTDRGTPVVQKEDDPLARTTTPPIDEINTRGKATINNTARNDAANRAGHTAGTGGSAQAGSGGNDTD